MKEWLLGAVMVAAVGLMAGCGSAETDSVTAKNGMVQIEVRQMKYSARQITVETGKPVKLVLINRDTMIHDFTVDLIKIDVTAQTASPKAHTHSEEKEPDLHVAVDAGQKGFVEFTPEAAGTYTFYCSVSGHRGMGMEGTLVVK